MGVTVGCEHSEQFSLLMSMDLDGLLDAADKSNMLQHLASCPSCQAEWLAMQRVSALLESADLTGPPLGFAVRVERRLEEKARKRQRALRGLAVVTGSLSLAGTTVAATTALVFALLIWLWPGSQNVLQPGGSPLSQLASSIGLLGKGMTLFLKDVFLTFGIPLLLLAGTGLAVVSAVWAWLFSRRSGRRAANGN